MEVWTSTLARTKETAQFIDFSKVVVMVMVMMMVVGAHGGW